MNLMKEKKKIFSLRSSQEEKNTLIISSEKFTPHTNVTQTSSFNPFHIDAVNDNTALVASISHLNTKSVSRAVRCRCHCLIENDKMDAMNETNRKKNERQKHTNAPFSSQHLTVSTHIRIALTSVRKRQMQFCHQYNIEFIECDLDGWKLIKSLKKSF